MERMTFCTTIIAQGLQKGMEGHEEREEKKNCIPKNGVRDATEEPPGRGIIQDSGLGRKAGAKNAGRSKNQTPTPRKTSYQA